MGSKYSDFIVGCLMFVLREFMSPPKPCFICQGSIECYHRDARRLLW